MQPQRLFVYDNYVQAVVVTGYEETENMPISNTPIKAYKGANQTIKFGIFDSDGKPWNVAIPDDGLFGFKVIDTRNDVEVIQKELTLSTTPNQIQGKVRQSVRATTPATYFECILTRGDLEDLDSGDHYSYVVYQLDDNGVQQEFLHTNIGYDVPGDFEVLDTAGAQFRPSTDTGLSTEWIEVTPGVGNGYENFDKVIVGDRANAIADGWVLYASTVYPAAQVLGYADGLHTAVVYPNQDLDGLTGTLRISGTLAANPPQLDENMWFPIVDESGVIYHEYTSATAKDAINFSGNFTWIRFDLYVQDYGDQIPVPPSDWPDQGHIDKILFRI